MNWQNKIQIDPPAIILLLPMSTENRSDTWSQELEKKCAECVSTSYYYFASYCWQWGGTPARAAAFIRAFPTGMKLRSQKLEKISVLSEWVSYYHFASYCWQWGGAAAAVTQRWLSRNNWHLQIYHFLLLSPSWFTILHFHIVSVLLMYKRGKFPFLAFLEEA